MMAVDYLKEMIIGDMSDYDDFFEMANYETRDSGLPFNIWFDEPGGSRFNKHHLPRVKVQVNGKFIPVHVTSEPSILLRGSFLSTAEKLITGSDRKAVFAFVARNHELILSHWSGEVSTKHLLTNLK
jgi:hypothetical protein